MSFIQNQFELPGAKAHYNPDRPGNVDHIFLDLQFDLLAESFGGVAYLTLNPIRGDITSLTLNACEMTISEVSLDNKEVEYSYDSSKIEISLKKPLQIGKTVKIAISYTVEKPRLGITFVNPNEFYPNKPRQVWSQGESEQSRYWYPCFDYPKQICTSEIQVKIPKEFTAISNGLKISEQIQDNFKIVHWKQSKPHPNYLIALTIGDFAEIKDKWKDIEVNYYTEKGREEMLQRTGEKTPKMIEFYSNYFGVPYIWEKYHQVWISDFTWGGMENTTMTINTDKALVDAKAEIDYPFGEILVAHELSHQWFGDLIVIDHWAHLWVKEGAATYSESLWWEYAHGEDEFAYYRYQEDQEYLDEGNNRYKRSMATNVYREDEDLYDRHSYTKAGCVYHLLRSRLGDGLFRKVLKNLLINFAHKNVEGKDLLRTIEETTGLNMQPLFDQYVYRGGHPTLKVGYNWDNENKLAKISVEQTQAKDNNDREKLFNLPKVKLCFGFVNEDKLEKNLEFNINLDQKQQTFYFPLEKKPDFISFDPKDEVLKDIELDYALPELKNQLLYDQSVISRIYAAQAIAKKASLEAVKILQTALEKESFWGVKVEIIESLGKIKLDQVEQILTENLENQDVRVCRAAVGNLAKIKTEKTFQTILALCQKEDRSYFLQASLYSALGAVAGGLRGDFVDKATAVLDKALQEKNSWNEVIRSGALRGLSALKESEKALEILLSYTKMGVPNGLRLTAVGSLGAISIGQSEVNVNRILDTLGEMAKDNYIHMERMVVEAASNIKSTRAISILGYITNKTLYGRVRRICEEGIEKIQQKLGPDKAISEMQIKLEEIAKENQKLKSRIEEIEAKSEVKNS